MIKIVSILMFTVMLGAPSLTKAEDEWWFAKSSDGTCIKSIGEYDWLTPDHLVNKYSCKVTKEVRSVVSVSCNSGDFKDSNFAFSQNEIMCKVFAKILYDNKGKNKKL